MAVWSGPGWKLGLLSVEESSADHRAQVAKAEVPHALASADIFLNTSNVDNTPVSVIEAMATGMCIVSTDVGGVAYLCETDEDALLVPAKDAKAMAAAVRRILIDPELAAALSCNARRKAETFDWSIILPQWESLLREVAPHEPKREARLTPQEVVVGPQ